MPEFLVQTLPVIVMMLISIGALGYVVMEYRKSLKETFPDKSLVDHARERSFNLIHDAIRKSQAIVSQAEMDALKTTAENKVQTHKLEEAAQKQIGDSMRQSQQMVAQELAGFNQNLLHFTQNLNVSQQEYLTYINKLKGSLDQAQVYNSDVITQQVNKLFEKFEQQLMDTLAKTEQESIYAVELEIKAARQLIDLYKQQQLKLVDENVIAVLERTLSLVLAKKLTLQDQIDLVYEALEKAKAEKFIA